MDFSTLVSTGSDSEGSWLHIGHPATGEPLYLQDDGKVVTGETERPCRVLVRSNRAPEVRAVTKARERAEELHAMRLMRASPDEAQRLITADAKAREAHQKELLVAVVADWENIPIRQADGPAAFSRDNVLAALSHPNFMVQIFRRSADEAALFTSAPTG